MCFTPEQCTLFHHLNFQKCSERGVSVTWKCVLHHKGMQVFIFSTSKSDLNLVCFVHFVFDAPRQNGVHFFIISTSKNDLSLVCFVPLTSNFARRHKGAHFLNIWIARSSLNVVCFVNFDFHMSSRHGSLRFFHVSTSQNARNLKCFVHFVLVAPRCRAIFHFSVGQVAPLPPP